ncbi:hypothetical protein AC579_5680 [Pseudocercospora musae]|uniref:Uncharacterized protein n=1 Tax=Pseudocercospora musae TaxID=113226 RepID=A0A139HCR6_9PEZI|nr:hypothetical protein AC579_5680 [Pseudocercospora musae]
MSIPLCTTSAARTSTCTTAATITAATTFGKRRRSCSPTPTPALTPPLSPTILKPDDNDSSRPRKRVRRVRVLIDTPATTPPTRTGTDTDTHDSQLPSMPPPSHSRSPSPSSPSPPASRSPSYPRFTAIDPNFGRRVMQAYIDNITRHKQREADFARVRHACRVTKYGAELADAYAPGSTPPRAREKYRDWKYTRPPTLSLPLDHVQSSYDPDDDGARTPASDVPDSPPAYMVPDQEEDNREEQLHTLEHTLDAQPVHENACRGSNSKADLHVLSQCEGRRTLALDIDRELDRGGAAKRRGDV